MKAFQRGQNIAELAILLVLLISAFAAMQIYIKRGVSGKVKDLTDAFIGNTQKEFIGLSTESSGSTSSNSTTQMKLETGGSAVKAFIELTDSGSSANSQAY
jgi:hypothetical protein